MSNPAFDLAALLKENPKTLRVDGRPTICSIAAAFYQELIDCDSPNGSGWLESYMQAEGRKRVPAFVFERLFMKRIALNHEVSGGWFVCRNGAGDHTWFNLRELQDDRNDLDDCFASLLSAQGIDVWHAWFAGKKLFLARFLSPSEVFDAVQFLEENPAHMRSGGQVRAMDTHAGPPSHALNLIKGYAPDEISKLLRSRIFMNCFLELTGGRPFDIDAVCRMKDKIFVAEFKRKYPARDGSFGIDKHLILLPRLLEHVCPLYHVILQDLRGDAGRNTDPTIELLSADLEGPTFVWRAMELKPRFEAHFSNVLWTHGEDSGQRRGSRQQRGIPSQHFKTLQGDMLWFI